MALTKEPLSAGDAMSFTTPYAIEKVPEEISFLYQEARDKRAGNCQSLHDPKAKKGMIRFRKSNADIGANV
jgi:hypothetical protein